MTPQGIVKNEGNSAREGALFMTKQFTFSMRSAISRWSCNPSSCVFSRNKNSNA